MPVTNETLVTDDTEQTVKAGLDTPLFCVIHKQELTSKHQHGILRYFHADDSACVYMNELDIEVGAIMGAMVDKLDSSPLARLGFLCSSIVRLKIYEDLSKIKDFKALNASLTLINNWLNGIDTHRYQVIAYEMGSVFGDVVLANLANINLGIKNKPGVLQPQNNSLSQARGRLRAERKDLSHSLPMVDVVNAARTQALNNQKGQAKTHNQGDVASALNKAFGGTNNGKDTTTVRTYNKRQ